VIGASAVALLVFSFLPWFSFTEQFSRNGWDYPLFGIVPVLIGLAMLGGVIVVHVTGRPPDLPVSWGQAHLIAGGLAAALILIKLLAADQVDVIFQSVTLDRRFGVYLAFLAALGLAIGGYIKTREPAPR
jgi:hypothetical protein